jgi:4-aminobutyrate aminotransferase
MIGIEFVKDRETREADHDLRDRITELAFERGLIMLGCGGNAIRISPPLNISRTEIDEGLKIFEQAITLAEREMLISYAA